MQNFGVNVTYLPKESQIYKQGLTSFMENINRTSNSYIFKRLKTWWCPCVTSWPSIACAATSLKKYSWQENPLDCAYNSYWLSQQFSQELMRNYLFKFSTTKELQVLLEITHAKRPHQGLIHGLQGNLCCSAWSTSLFIDLGVCRILSVMYYMYCHSSLLLQKALMCVFSLLKYVSPEALPPLLMRSALASSGSVLEPAGTGSIGQRRSF